MLRQTLKSSLAGNVDARVANNVQNVEAISNQDFAGFLAPYSQQLMQGMRFAVAVSGGADSMALCLLADHWARTNGGQIIALTVDHGLRAEAEVEAEQVSTWLASHNIEHRILTWHGIKPETGIQATARRARYTLLTDFCRHHDFTTLLTAHHLEDQVETFFLRAERGSGLDGLACMPPVSVIDSITLLRPLLQVPKSRLRHTLKVKNQNWLEDPSNQDLAFRRVKMRQLAEQLSAHDLPIERVAKLIDQFGAVRGKLSEVVTQFVDDAAEIYPAGYAVLRRDILCGLPLPIIERIIVRLVSVIGGKPYPPRRDRLRRAVGNIIKANFPAFTLSGCRFSIKDNEIMICRESRGMARIVVTAGDHVIWDNRYVIDVVGRPGGQAHVAPLGKEGWAEIRQKDQEIRENSLPHAVRLTLPALIDEAGIFEVPHLGYRRPGGQNPGLHLTNVQFRQLWANKKLSK